uniref:Uncharacterized protein n=1 Tax=Pipistrellus kuhlii TaxID=59472 RepID=A0A7J7SUV9_PIPKU|nr:hypothetical protein mPipKuh1_009769 [Pipistrellus kuhlii]
MKAKHPIASPMPTEGYDILRLVMCLFVTLPYLNENANPSRMRAPCFPLCVFPHPVIALRTMNISGKLSAALGSSLKADGGMSLSVIGHLLVTLPGGPITLQVSCIYSLTSNRDYNLQYVYLYN